MQQGTPEEYADAMRSYIHYSGTVEVDAESGQVLHHVDGSLFPNWKGGIQRRFYEFSEDGDRLELTTAPLPFGEATAVGALAWKRTATF